MKRNIKNIIMLILVVLVIGAMVFTMYYAKDHITLNNNEMTNENSTPPSMPNDQNSSSNDNGQNSDTPPSKPDGESNDEQNNNTNEPPEKPSDSDNNESSTSDDAKGSDQNSNTVPSMPNGSGNMNGQNSVDLTVCYYVVFAIESLILSSLIIYIIMSCFNKKTFKETFVNSDKVIIAMLSVIILTTVFTYTDKYITTEYFLDNDSMSFSNNTNIAYNGKTTIDEDTTIEEGSYTSSTSDENAILVNGSTTSISNVKVIKTGDSDGGDSTSFYGTNSAITAKSGANLTLKNIEVTTNATGANGVFSYGGSATTNNSSSDGTTVTISDSKITTKKDNSGGIMTTGGGTMNANNLTINTSGTSSAAIRSDRGGGNVNVVKGTYTTTGKGSPAIYSTANIKVSDATLISKASEGVVIEGKNSVSLENCTLTDTNSSLNGQSTTYKNIFLYQSMSGDASVGNSEFTAKNSTITTNKGDTLYATNTSATFNLENNTIINNDKSGYFLRAQSDSWGTKGQNGADVVLNLTNQKVTGNIYIDEVSTLDFSLSNNSYYEGSINTSNISEEINLTLDKSSKIKLTGDTYVTSLSNKDSSNSNIDFNGYKLYVNGKAIN
jgi:hypothetical protein